MDGSDPSARDIACKVMVGYAIWNPRPVDAMKTSALGDEDQSIDEDPWSAAYLSIT